jgi:hypothetical protein
MWQFIPRLPTPVAWSQRLFKRDVNTIQEVIGLITQNKTRLAGEFIIDNVSNKTEISLDVQTYFDGSSLTVPFGSAFELNEIYKKYKVLGFPDHRVNKIYIYQHGYFVH